MILEALVKHYDRLADDPESGIAAYGFSSQQVAFCVVLKADGTLHAIEEMTDESAGKPRPVKLILPGQAKPSGSGVNPCFLWDNPAYMLGFVPQDTPAKQAERTAGCFAAFREKHLALQEEIGDEGFSAVCAFLKAWEPANLNEPDVTEAFNRPGFGVFRIRGEAGFVHERSAVRGYWLQQLETTADPGTDVNVAASDSDFCLITGRHGPLARLHEPKIKGVSGAQSSGAALVSFNDKAYESHGKEQGLNAPVSEVAAFQYTTALNHLLADRKHRVQLGDTTCVFWTEKPETGAADALADAMDNFWLSNQSSADDKEIEAGTALRDFLNRYRKAQAAPAAVDLEDGGAPFYVLGLAPNAARISVRFWLRCTVAELAQRLGNHVDRTAVFDSRTQAVVHPALRELLRETGREAKDIPPQLAGEMARAILTDKPYPNAFATALLRRIVADTTVNPPRAAGLKAWLIRNYQLEVPVSLDPARTDTAYLLGRLFAAYEKVQEDSVEGKLNRTIRDSYLSSASATPAGIFPRLYRLNQHHFNKLRRDKPGLAVVREKLIGEICNPLTDFPRHLKLQEQGLFAIGYYHQIQDFYTKRSAPDDQPTPTPNPSEED